MDLKIIKQDAISGSFLILVFHQSSTQTKTTHLKKEEVLENTKEANTICL